eukprot:308144_1
MGFYFLWVQLLWYFVVSQEEYCFFGDNSVEYDVDKDPRVYYGSFVELMQMSFAVDTKIYVNGEKIYKRGKMYDTDELWMAKYVRLNTWILTEYEPSATPLNIIATCICMNVLQCDLIDCQEWYWGEHIWAVSSELLPSVTIQNRLCETCRTNNDCNAFRAEICCDGSIECVGIPINTCVHVGWITLLDHKIYVLETDGIFGVPVQRYGFPRHIKLSASATWKVIKGTTEADNKEAVYFYDLPFEQQQIGIMHYDFTTENPNNTKNWHDGQLSYVDIIVEINDDGVFETDFEEFQIQIFPKENVFLKTSDLNVMSVIIIAPNSGNRGSIQFSELKFQVYEEDKTIEIPVERVNGSDGAVSVEYSVINKKLPETATFGRDYKEFGIWERILHHECDYLQPLGSLLPVVTDLMSAQRYFDVIANSGYPKNASTFSSDAFLSKFQLHKADYQYPKEWTKGFGCCSNTLTQRTYPEIYDYEWLQFRLEWPLDSSIKYDQIWPQMNLPIFYNSSTVTSKNPADISLKKLKYNNKDHGPNILPKYNIAWKGLASCDIGQDCVFQTVPAGYQIGKRILEESTLSATYRPEYCLSGPFIDVSFADTNAASLYIKNFKTAGRIHWADGDTETKMITIEIIDDDEYELTEEFTVMLSVTPHPNPQYNPLINSNSNEATVYIIGPNDVNLGTIGFKDYLLYTNEGEVFCIPLIRTNGADEAAYVQYNCEGQTASDSKGTFDNPQDFEWISSKFGEFMWQPEQNDTKCINIYVFKDEMYEKDEDILCEITQLWSDYSDLKPMEGHMKVVIVIKSNGDQIRVDTPWIIANEGDTAKLRISRFGFIGKHVSVKYKTAECRNINECKLDNFAITNIDFNETIGELMFYANESFSNKTIEIPIISDGIQQETNAFMFFIEKGEIITPIQSESDKYVNVTYIYNIYESSAIIWIHGPNDIPHTEFVLWNNVNNSKYENSFIWKLDEPIGNITMDLYSIYVARLQDNKQYNFECSVNIHCDSHTASAGRDFVCNDTTFYWNIYEHDIKEFKFSINNDQHWEHEEVFYITLSNPMNAIVRDKHKYITVAIIANDIQNCTGSVIWNDWTNCSVSIGTGIQMRYKTSIEKDNQTGNIECIQLSQSKYCQMIDHSAIGITTTYSVVTLYEGDYTRDHIIITYSLGGTPNFFDDKYANNDFESLDDCVVKLVLTFDDNLDVSATPVFLCWTNITWAEKKNVTIRVEDNDKIDSINPRKRYIEVGELVSVDPLYEELNKRTMQIEVLVFDDEYCDINICKRGQLSKEYNEIEYEDEIREIKTDETEIIVILVIFVVGIMCLISLTIRGHMKRNKQTEYESLDEKEHKEELDIEMKEMEEITKMEKYLAKQHAKKQKKREKELKKNANSAQERQSLLLKSSEDNQLKLSSKHDHEFSEIQNSQSSSDDDD